MAWFYRILKNAVIDDCRKAGIEQRAHDRLERESEAAFEPELRDNICTCVSAVLPTLNPAYAEIVGDVELGERSIAEVASEKHLTVDNARPGSPVRRRKDVANEGTHVLQCLRRREHRGFVA